MTSNKSTVTFSSKSSKASVATIKEEPKKKNYYDEWRPPAGVRYQLSQTNIDINAVVPRVKLEYTTVEYEPGQDLTVPEEVVSQKYAKPRGRGPVFVFQEEIDEAKRKKIQQQLIDHVLDNIKRHKKQQVDSMKGIHNELMHAIGPIWYHELSVEQMKNADALKAAMLEDNKRGTIINTQETLSAMGLVLWPNHTKVEYALKKYYLCPVEFLLTIFNLNRPKEPEKSNVYTLNDRIILSCVVHLSMRETLRELHLRIPSPPPSDKPRVHRFVKVKKNKWKKVKWHKGMSPYLKPLIPVVQKHKDEVYKNRHKEYASLEYFDYVEDMYDVFYEDDPESVKKRKQLKRMKKTKWTKPPKIPVRYIESKMKKKRVCQLKKPTPYTSPCKLRPQKVEPEPEPEPEEEEPVEDLNICCCSPQTFNENTAFDLKIRITTNEDEYILTQKLCPYRSTNTIGDLHLIEQSKIVKEEEEICCEEEVENEGKPFKKIEYSCECCTCGKTVNIFPEENANIEAKNLNSLKELINCQGCLDTIPEEEDTQLYEEVEMDYEQSQSFSEICKCKSRSGSSSSTDIDDPYYLCTCKSSSDSCTCCICDQMDKDFKLRIKRYNEAFNTNHQPCLCACRCKKYKKPVCCNAVEEPCKYCFCKKKKDDVLEEEKGEVEEEEKVPEKKMELEVKGDPQKESKERKITIRKTIENILEPNECECEKMFNNYLDAHESCMSLFINYQKKIEEDVTDYLRDIKYNRCLCGDSLSSDQEGKFEEEEFKFLEDLKEEQSSDSECICQKGKRGVCSCCNDSPDDFYAGCTCNPTGVALTGCTCNNTSSSSEETTTSDSNNCCCACTCGQGPCKCEEFLLKVKEEKARLAAEREETLIAASKKSLGLESFGDELSEEQSENVEEIDPRIMILDEFPTNPKEQMKLLKTALAALAEDGYPLAKLPDVHRLPHFKVWLNKRTRAYVSMDDREFLYQRSKNFWNHIEICNRTTPLPDPPLSKEKMHSVTWGGVNKYKNMISVVNTDYSHRLKQNYISQAQELFPSMFHYELPNKTFRNVYFSYLAADENHIFVFKPWQLHERKEMSGRQPC